MGVLTEADGLALEMLCYNYARFRRCADKLEDTPEGFVADIFTSHTGDRKPSPYVGMCKTSMAEIRSLLGEFGLTPSSRTRISLPELAEVDEFEEFLNRGKETKRPGNHLRAVGGERKDDSV
jgi:P27 family predicted phage terminase small subunit